MKRNSRLGLTFFTIYAAVYLIFVLLNAYAPDAMEKTPFAGLNLAVLGGLGLIALAFVLALAYGLLCRVDTEDDAGERRPRP